MTLNNLKPPKYRVLVFFAIFGFGAHFISELRQNYPNNLRMISSAKCPSEFRLPMFKESFIRKPRMWILILKALLFYCTLYTGY